MPDNQPIFGVNPDEDEHSSAPVEGQAVEGEGTEGQAPREGISPDIRSDPLQGGQPVEGREEDTPSGEPQRLYAGKFDSPDKLEQSYEELQRKLGQQGNALGQMQQQYNQLLQYVQQMQVAQQTTPRTQQAEPAQQVDPGRFIEDLEARGPAVIEELVNRIVTQRWAQEGEVLGQGIAQTLQPLYQHYMQSQLRESVQGQINSARSKHNDFDDYREDVKRIIGEQPQLLSLPTGVEVAYQMAKAQRGGQQTAAMQQMTAAQKRAAQMPSSGAGGRPQQQQISPEDAIRQAVFGTPNSQGVFG